ncbi:AcrR family transcriptional regulator [Saccharomonospora amisosensis]|uniref:AcrR family transcriptional regulator n=1 Tax=Saccharomonospora amisosensis TaxID=1128677 RepID=A0A7X5ZTU1_9PSEU|nr:TetR/AcrR family transcriptional regulator [Saccharomonospora amisosensis]NIJ14665.1 AcrR family transcriptional regulator [Saccharomonospora amisosensis]
MTGVKSRRELYSEATRAAVLEQATALFAERGYAGTLLEDVAAAAQVTRGAVYHHFAGKQALFEAVLDEQESRMMEAVRAAATSPDPWQAAMQALDAFLDRCCEPVYGRLCWQEAPTALGFQRWQEYEQKYAYGLVAGFIENLRESGGIETAATLETTVDFCFWMLGGAGLALVNTPDTDKQRVRDEWGRLMQRALAGLRP